MKLFLSFVIVIATTVYSADATSKNDEKSKTEISRTIPRISVRIKPNESKWDILGYECYKRKCTEDCNGHQGNAVSACMHKCECSSSRLVNSLPMYCILGNKVECQTRCLGDGCQNTCHKTIHKNCQYMNL